MGSVEKELSHDLSFKCYLSGRPQWFDVEGVCKKPLVIGVAGGTASGKTSICKAIIESLQLEWVVVLSMDSFYRGLDPSVDAANYDFDHPDAFDFPLITQTLKELKKGKSVKVPSYDFVTHQRTKNWRTVYGADVIIFEGILAFYEQELRDQIDIKIFAQTDPDTRLARRVRRDVAERGRSVDGVIQQYLKTVKPAFDEFVQPSIQYADIIIPLGKKNKVAVNLITQHIKFKMQDNIPSTGHKISPLPTKWDTEKVTLMRETSQIKAIHTILRDRTTTHYDFVFYADRLSCLLVEEALATLPALPLQVKTPTDTVYHGVQPPEKHNICAVSIMRAGEAMEKGVEAVSNHINIGKILIQSVNKKPRLYYLSLPNCQDAYVLLLEPTLATGSTMKMALRVLIENGVQPNKIIIVSFLASPQGICNVLYSFPDVRIVVSAVDEGLDENRYIKPGIGNFGDRYYLGE